MKSIYIYLGAIICLLCACSTDEHLPDVSKFYYPIPATPLKEAVNLGAYYYTYKTDEPTVRMGSSRWIKLFHT